jgi:predicted nucleic acid-binding protein
MHLLDTDVVWALRRSDPAPSDAPVLEWISDLMPSTLFLSAVTMMEFESGTARLERKDKATATSVRAWLETRLRPAFEGRILGIDDAVVRRWSKLGYSDMRDGLLASTAQEHGLTIATRNLAAFKTGKIKTFNPWTHSADAAELDWRQASQSAPLWLKSLFVRA